jgi:hypothetical protein
VRNSGVIFLLVAVMILTSCFNSRNKAVQELESNNMRFKFWERMDYADVSFRVPKMFINSNCYSNFTINPSLAFQGCAQQVELYFGIEAFNDDKAADFQYLVQGRTPLEGVQQHYVNRKLFNSQDRIISLKDHWKLPVGKAIFQSIVQHRTKTNQYDTEYASTTFVATFEKNRKFYVVQMTGHSDVMVSLYADFKKILYSCK